MSVEIFLRKRKAREGEIGLFVESQVFEDDWSSVKIGAEVVAELSVPVHPKYRKFFHALCGKLADGVEWFNGDKDFAKEQLLLQCRHATYHHDRLRDKTEIRAKTTANLDADGWIRLLRRANYVAVNEYLPGVPEGVLKDEIEKMLGMGPLDLSAEAAAPPERPEPARRTRATRAPKASPEPSQGQSGKEVNQPHETAGEAVPAGSPAAPSPHEETRSGDRPVPTNEAEYILACRSWITRQTASHVDARQYFEGGHHVELRRKCGVGIGTRNTLRRELAEHYEKGTSNAKS